MALFNELLMLRLKLLLGVLACLALPALSQTTKYEFLDDEAEPHFDVSFGVKTETRGGLTVAFDWKDNLNFYALELMPDSAALRAVVNGRPQRLATTKINWSANPKVTIKRRPWTMQVIVDKRVVLTAYDGSLNEGRIGSLASAGWKWTEPRVQPVDEEIVYDDDYTRAEGQGNDWQDSGGKWTLTATSDNITQKNVAMSANPFSYLAETPGGSALAYIEPRKSRFWDNYEARISVRPGGRGAIGLAVYVQDPKNYLAFTWNATEGPQARQLIRVEDGKAMVIERAPGAFLPRQWYRLSVRTSPGFIETFIDGTPVFKTRDDSFGQGGIGLLAQNMAAANFDDLHVRSYDYYRLDFTGAVSGAWDEVGGSWAPLENQKGVLASSPTKDDKGATRVYLTGRNDWPSYEFSVAARSGEAGAAGIIAGYTDKGNYTVFRWAGSKSVLPYKGRQQILTFRDGKAQVVRDEPVELLEKAAPDGFVPVRLRVVPGAFAVYIGDKLIAQRADENITPGRPGLYSQGLTTTQYRDAVMYFPPPAEPPKVAPKMAEDALMVGWASPAGEWPTLTGDSGQREFWNTGEFFGDAALEYRWRNATNAGQKLEFALRAEKGKFESGYLLRLEGLGKKDGVRVILNKGAQTLKQADLNPKSLAEADEAAPDEANALKGVPLKVHLEGHGILLYIGDKPVMSYVADEGETMPQGTYFAARSATSIVRTRDLRAISTNRDDYTFTEAPTDWYSVQGQWAVISRWPCYSDWSFFGGKGLNPVLWSKRSYGLDTVVEIYASNQMDLPKELGYSNPGNLNITLLGDGKNPSSGYSFVVAGWHNTTSKILKGTQTIAQNATENARFERPINQNLSFQKRWFYIRAEARRALQNGQNGVLLRLTVDDTKLMEFFDADPLPQAKNGGQVGFWTVDGAMMIARAKIESASMGPRTLPVGLIDAAATVPAEPIPSIGPFSSLLPRPQMVDGLPAATIESAEGAWTVRNPTAGGTFGVNLIKPGTNPEGYAPIAASPQSKLEWEWQPNGAKVDFYVTLGDQMNLLPLTGNAGTDARAQLLGDVKQIATVQDLSGGWQKVTVSLGAALQKQFPNASEWKVDALTLGALHGDEYRLLGFNSNALGASYKIKNVRLVD
jgi:hypothetical protein